MAFSVNSPILYIVVGIIIAVVLAQSIFFLVKSWKRGIEIGMDKDKLRRIAKTAVIFTIAPAIAIVISVITLAQSLGIPLPWLRLSVVGNLSYETIAATNALNAMGLTFGNASSLTAQEYVTIACVMTASIMVGIWLVPVVAEKLQNGIINLENKNSKLAEVLSASMFIGMISAFIGYVFCDFSTIFHGDPSGLIPVFVFAISAAIMICAGALLKKTGWRWITDYALPVSLIVGMASAIPLTAWLG